MAERFARVLQAVREHPWAIVPTMFEAILEVVALRAGGGQLSADEIAARIGAERNPTPQMRVGSVAVLSLHGVLSQRMNLMAAISGGTSTELFGQAFDEAVADKDVQAIVLDVDSPGGSVSGTEELAQKIYKARGSKPIVAIADSLAASAAYWIGSQAHEFVASPSSQVGSIGVVTTHTDVSKAEEQFGQKTTVIAIPSGKAEGHSYAPLSEDALANKLASMQPFYDLFVKAVARGRGISAKDVRDGYGQGRVLAAVPARDAGMVDRIETLSDVIARLSTPQGRRAVLTAHSPSAVDATTDQEPVTATSQESRPQDLRRAALQLELDTL